jgi:hypothetical protein
LNEGTVALNSAGTATIIGNYTTYGTTELKSGILALSGAAEQTGGWFKLNGGNWRMTDPTKALNIRDGAIVGSGTVDANLTLGYPNPADPNTTPVLSPGAPGGGGVIGTITVTRSFHLFSGEVHIEITGPNTYDKIAVTGHAAISGPAGRTRKVFGNVLPVHAAIQAQHKFPFLTYSHRPNNDRFAQEVFDAADGNWEYGTTDDVNPQEYWVRPLQDIAAAQGRIGGLLWLDTGAVAGIFEPGVENKLANIPVELRDETGNNVVDSTTSNANGEYEFNNLPAGLYFIKFHLPLGQRFVAATTNPLGSDPDPITGMAPVWLAEDDDVDDVFAGYYDNTNPVAVNDAFGAHKNTPVSGNVLLNDSDGDGDELSVTVDAGPSNGQLTLNPDGSFTYTPNTDWHGTDTFTYAIDDGYGGTATGTVTVTVANTPPPAGSNITYTTPAELTVDAENGVLADVTNPNNHTLVAVLATGPSSGTLTLNSDGSFTYTPDWDFVGTDSFTFYPRDNDGPGNSITVYVSVTDTPPVAEDDVAYTVSGTAVTLAVLGNDTDVDEGDELTVLGASDGIYGTTTVNPDGSITYTPAAGWTGTDWFTYVIDDGYGRLSYATATVTVYSATYSVPHFGVTLAWSGVIDGRPTWTASGGWTMQYLPPDEWTIPGWTLVGPGAGQEWQAASLDDDGSTTFTGQTANPSQIEVVAGT